MKICVFLSAADLAERYTTPAREFAELIRAKARADADEMVFGSDLAERNALLLAGCDAVVVMVGGLGRWTRRPRSWNYASMGSTTNRWCC